MNDPFAMLDPMAKAKAPTIGGNAPASYATTPMNFGQAPGFPMQQQSANPFGGPPPQQQQQYGGGMGMMVNNNMQQQMQYNNGAAFMTQPGPASFSGLPQGQHQQQQHAMASNPFMQPQQQQATAPFVTQSMNNNSNPFGGGGSTNNMYPSQQQQLDPFGTQMKTSGGAGGFMPPQLRPAEPTMPPAPLRHSSSIIVDFDPFSPRDNTPRTPYEYQTTGGAQPGGDRTGSADFGDRRRQTQEAQRSQLGFSSDSFNASNAPKISLKELANQPPNNAANATNTGAARGQSNSFDDSPFFTDNDDAFADHNMFANLDDEPTATNKKDWGQFAKNKRTGGGGDAEGSSGTDEDEIPDECNPNEYDVTFETGRKLGVLMERVDVWGKSREDKRQEIAVVKLVVENGAADRVGVTTGSSVVAINARSVARDSYAVVLDMIKAAPRPMSIRFKRGTVNKDTTQGNVLTRISNGTFSVGNLTRGNASWTDKYFAFGGAKMDVLQLFVSRAAYHECVISLYEKRPVHTQIQSFRLCRDHKITPIKSKIYKGYGNLHYFSLSVPSLRFIAAKFSSEDYETLKNLWSNTYDAIERKKRMGY